MRWECLSFPELTTRQLYQILQLRAEIFVVEQSCVYQDLDDHDQNGFHLLGWDGEDLVAYARILPAGTKYPKLSIGRISVMPSHRGRGLAKEATLHSVQRAQKHFPNEDIFIQSQAYLEEFYRRLGFRSLAESYIADDGILHVGMIYAPQQ